MLKKSFLILLIIGLVLSGAVGCSGESDEESPTETNGEETYSIKIYVNDKLTGSVTLEEIDSLDKVAFSTEDKDEEGPILTDVLEFAGIEDFNKVTAVGMTKGRIASAELTLERDQIDDTVILDITNRGTTKLAGKNISSNDWIIDVSELRIE